MSPQHRTRPDTRAAHANFAPAAMPAAPVIAVWTGLVATASLDFNTCESALPQQSTLPDFRRAHANPSPIAISTASVSPATGAGLGRDLVVVPSPSSPCSPFPQQ